MDTKRGLREEVKRSMVSRYYLYVRVCVKEFHLKSNLGELLQPFDLLAHVIFQWPDYKNVIYIICSLICYKGILIRSKLTKTNKLNIDHVFWFHYGDKSLEHIQCIIGHYICTIF